MTVAQLIAELKGYPPGQCVRVDIWIGDDSGSVVAVSAPLNHVGWTYKAAVPVLVGCMGEVGK